MAYRTKRRTSRAAPRRASRRTYSPARRRSAPASRRRRVSARAPRQQTVRLVIQTVGGLSAGGQPKASVVPLRAMF